MSKYFVYYKFIIRDPYNPTIFHDKYDNAVITFKENIESTKDVRDLEDQIAIQELNSIGNSEHVKVISFLKLK